MSGEERQDLKELAAAYALGALGDAEARAFEAYLATSPEAQREVAEYREVNALLAESGAAGLAVPSPDLRPRMLERIGKLKAVPLAPHRSLSWTPWAAAAAIVLALGLGFNVVSLKRQLAEQQVAMDTLRADLAARESRLAEREATLDAILEPGVTLTRLTSTAQPEPVIQLFWNRRSNRAITHAFALAPISAGRVYQLWFIPKGGAPIPSVTFTPESSGHALVQNIEVPAGLDLAAAAITNEPEGGSPQPTTPVLMVGSFGT